MSNNTQELKAAQRREKFAGLLREMFQLDQPELVEELKRVQGAVYKTDPKNWKCGDFLKRGVTCFKR